jgi:hypothetical protein
VGKRKFRRIGQENREIKRVMKESLQKIRFRDRER